MPTGGLFGSSISPSVEFGDVAEAAADLPEDLRAFNFFHPPTLYMLDELGVVDKVIEQGIGSPHLRTVILEKA